MKTYRFLAWMAASVLIGQQHAGAAAIDVNQTFNYTSTTAAANTDINWSALTWDSTPTWGAGVTAGIPNGSGTTSLARTYTVDVVLTLKQLQLYNHDATVLKGGTITWDSGEAGVQCDLGRNRHTMANYAAGRNFTVSPDFVLNSDLRVTNWVESRITTYNSNTSGDGKLTLRIVPWGGGNTCAMNIGGTAANTHTGGTTLTMGSATMNTTINKAEAFGTGVLTLNGNGIINVNLSGWNQTVAGLVSSGSGAHVFGNSTTAALATLTLNLKDGATTTFAKSIGSASATYGNNLALVVDKASGATGTGVQVLSGTNTFTGSLTVSGATLRLLGAQALSGSSAVTLGAGAVLDYVPSSDVQLALPGTLTLTGGTGTRVGTAVGSTATSASIAATGVASATAGTITLDIAAVPGVSPAPGTYTLISGGDSSSTLDGATYALGTVWNATNFTVNTPVGTTTAVTAELVAATPLATAYWKGGFAGHENAWAVSNGTSAGNWTTDAAGTAGTGLVPASVTDVVISATGASNQDAMVLGASMVINSLTVSDSSAVGLGADGNTLTITPAASTDGIEVDSGAGAVTIATPVVLGAAQTWTNASSNPLTVSGVMSGDFGITKSGSGVLVLGGSAANSFTGGVTLASGALHINKAGALGNGAGGLLIQGGTFIDNSSGAAVLVNTNNPLTIDGDFTFTGSNDLDLGNGDVTLGTAAGSARVITVAAGNLTIGGEISDGTTATSLTKAGSGTLTLYGFDNVYTGLTTVEEGTLELQGSIDFSSGVLVHGGATFDVGPAIFSLINSQTLGGNGTMLGTLFAGDNSEVSPGLSVGNLTVTGDVAIESSLKIEIDGATADRLDVSGELDISFATLDVTEVSPPTAGAYVIATYGTLVGPFLAVNGLPSGYELDYTYQGSNQIAIKQAGDDTFPPVWAASWPQVDTATTGGFTVRAKTDEAGTAYYVVLADGAAAPSAAQVKAGNDAADAPALQFGNISLTANTENTAAVTGLTLNTAYDVWFVAEDGIPNLQSTPVMVDAATLTTFAEWIGGFSVGGLTGLGDDPDKDGKSNVVEFGLNSSPASGSARGKVYVKLATVGGTPNVLTLTAAVRSGATFAADGNNRKAVVAGDALTYVIEAANTLADWGTPVVSEVTDAGELATIQTGLPTPDSGWVYKTFSTDGSAPSDTSDYIRVKVTSP